MIEALPLTTRGHREARLASAHNNVFLLDAEDITIDVFNRQRHGRDVDAAMGRADARR